MKQVVSFILFVLVFCVSCTTTKTPIKPSTAIADTIHIKHFLLIQSYKSNGKDLNISELNTKMEEMPFAKSTLKKGFHHLYLSAATDLLAFVPLTLMFEPSLLVPSAIAFVSTQIVGLHFWTRGNKKIKQAVIMHNYELQKKSTQ